MDNHNSYEWFNKGSKQKMNTKMMNFAVSKNVSNSRYDKNYTLTNAIPK